MPAFYNEPDLTKPRSEPADWNGDTERQIRYMLAGGWSMDQMVLWLQRTEDVVKRWITQTRKGQRAELDAPSDEFLADADAFFSILESRAIRGLASSQINPVHEGNLIKQAREAREARIKIRKDTGRIKVTGSGERDPSKMSDDEVDKELEALDGKLTRLDPKRRKKKA